MTKQKYFLIAAAKPWRTSYLRIVYRLHLLQPYKSELFRSRDQVSNALSQLLKLFVHKGLERSVTAQSDVRWGYLTDGGSERRLAASLRCFSPKSERVGFSGGKLCTV